MTFRDFSDNVIFYFDNKKFYWGCDEVTGDIKYKVFDLYDVYALYLDKIKLDKC